MRYNQPRTMNRTQLSRNGSTEPKHHVVLKEMLKQHPKRATGKRHSHPPNCPLSYITSDTGNIYRPATGNTVIENLTTTIVQEHTENVAFGDNCDFLPCSSAKTRYEHVDQSLPLSSYILC
ncbi:hypothetical protein DPMN_161537 [Dreissena polymorpha]|uniref:Uncharacterized protein n=1 Tax=Dreissena polymorpha TaxID=45954 RepID=A0A9D4EP29_DREPO|nr:hypothetical protein DPMN_161537 [Dreissena polymorpha]